jgi:hypothetical protein
MRPAFGRAALLKFFICSLALLPAAGATNGPQGEDPSTGGAIPASYFSMNILFHPLNHVPWPSIPLGGWRTSHTAWADIEPGPNQWNWALLDKYVNWSTQHHLEILMPLAYTPRWASSTPDALTDVEPGNPVGLSGAPRDMDDWRNYVRAVATRYKGRIHDWEIWNEPNRPQSWTGTVDQMVDLTREAAAILKQIDPTCTVVSSASTGTNGLKFFEAYISKGGGRYADVIGYHFYVGHTDPPEAATALIGSVKKILARNGLANKPVWNTEAGWLGDPPFPPEQQAAYVARAYIINWAAGVQRFYWYAWENHRGTQIWLTGPDNGSLTPAGQALATIENWMTGAVLSQCAPDDRHVWTCELSRGGTVSHLVWSAGGDTSFNVPAAWNAHGAVALDGERLTMQANSIAAGESPVLVQ